MLGVFLTKFPYLTTNLPQTQILLPPSSTQLGGANFRLAENVETGARLIYHHVIQLSIIFATPYTD